VKSERQILSPEAHPEFQDLDIESNSSLTPRIAKHGSGRDTTRAKTLLLGLGNDLLTDDAIGLRVVAEVRRLLKDHQTISVDESAEMGLALLDLVVGYETLIIVDAIQTNEAPPGFVHQLGGDDLNALPAVSPHFLGIGELLALGRELGLSVPSRVRIFAVEVQDPFNVGTQLTPALKAALPRIVECVLGLCAPGALSSA
jgi:hydrogenase maturation protease